MDSTWAVASRYLKSVPVARAACRIAPVTMLLAHAVELYLKAFLRLHGVTLKRLAGRKFGHNFKKLAAKAEAEGLTLDDEDSDVMTILLETGPATADSVQFALPAPVTTAESVPAATRHLADER